jgi:hypothetical protein
MLQTFHFNFNKEVTDELYEFSKLHQNDDRKTYKEAWQEWIKTKNIETLLLDECNRLKDIGYEGDIVDKMYKRSRYYFRKKPLQSPKPRERKAYEGLSRHILQCIDQDIQLRVQTAKQTKKANTDMTMIAISPEEAFAKFIAEHKHEIANEAQSENQRQRTISKQDMENLIQRVKKSYKNRFYKMRLVLNHP